VLPDQAIAGTAPVARDLTGEMSVTPDRPAPLPAVVESLTLHLCAEQLLAGWCAALSARSPAPLLGQIFVKLAAETAHRADAYAQELRRAVQRNPDTLPAVLRLALWVLRDGDRGRVPTIVAADGQPAPRRDDPHCIRRMTTLRRMLAG